MNIDNSLTEGVAMMQKVVVDLFLLDSTISSLDDDHLCSRSNFFASLCLMRKHKACEGHGPTIMVMLVQAPIVFLLAGLNDLCKASRRLKRKLL